MNRGGERGGCPAGAAAGAANDAMGALTDGAVVLLPDR